MMFIMLYLMLFLPFATPLEKNDELIANVMRELSLFKEHSGYDYLENLVEWSREVENLQHAYAPFAENIRKNETSSDKLTLLKSKTGEFWNKDFEILMSIFLENLDHMPVMLKIDKHVIHPTAIIRNLTHSIMDPTIEKNEKMLKDFTAACSDPVTGPKAIIDWLKQYMVDECDEKISDALIEKIVNTRSSIVDVLHRMNGPRVSTWQAPYYVLGKIVRPYRLLVETHLTEILLNTETMDPMVLKNLIEEASGSYDSYEQGMELFVQKLKDRRQGSIREEKCILNEVLAESFFNHISQSVSFIRQLKFNLMSLVYSSTICNEFMHDGNAADMEKYASHISDAVRNIESFVLSFFRKSQTANLWPHVHKQLGKESLLFESKKPLPFTCMYCVAALMQIKLNQYRKGPKEIMYEVLVSEKVDEFTPLLMPQYCTLVDDTFGYHVVICRLNTSSIKEEGDDGRSVELRWNSRRMKESVKTALDANYSEPIEKILTSLNTTTGGLIGEDGYHGVVILRNRRDMKQPNKPAYGIAPYDYTDLLHAITKVPTLHLDYGTPNSRYYSYDFVFLP